MKILRIRFANLASLESEVDIRLDSPPLSKYSVFAITGRTGAGKSTILDALCLSLFGKTPRYECERDTSKALDDLKLFDGRNILRKGSISGFAEVEFLGKGNSIYRSRWSVRRAREKSDGKIQDEERSLWIKGPEDNWTALGGKKQETQFAVEKALGLNFEQFRHSVLLAQGEFRRFLEANGPERSSLLETLTGTGIYSRISILAHQKLAKAKEQLHSLNASLDALQLLDEENLNQLSLDIDLHKKEISNLDSQIKITDRALNWHNQFQTLEKDKNQLIVKLQDLNNQLESLEKDAELVALWEKNDDLTQVWYRHRDLSQSCIQIEMDNRKTAENLKIQSELFNHSIINHTEYSKQYHDWQVHCTQLKPAIDKARELDLFISQSIHNLNKARESHLKAKKSILETTNLIDEPNLRLAEINNRLLKAEQWFSERQNKTACYDNGEILLLQLDAIYEDLNHFETDKLESMQHSVNFLAILHELSDKVKQNDFLLEWNSKSPKETDLKIKLDRIFVMIKDFLCWSNKSLIDLEEQINALDRAFSADVIYLRQNLATLHPCPVCGSLEHPYLDEAHQVQFGQSTAMLTKLREQLQDRKGMIQSTVNSQLELSKLGEHWLISNTRIQQFKQNKLPILMSTLSSLSDFPELEIPLQDQFNEKFIVNLRDFKAKFKTQVAEWQRAKKATELLRESKTELSIEIELSKVVEEYKIERLQLLDGESTQIVEAYEQERGNTLSKELDAARRSSELCQAELSRLEGAHANENANLLQNKTLIIRLEKELNQSLGDRKIDPTEFTNLMSMGREQFVSKRTLLKSLSDNLHRNQASLATLESQLEKLNLERPLLRPDEAGAERNRLLPLFQSYQDRLDILNATRIANEQLQKRSQLLLQELEQAKGELLQWEPIGALIGSSDGKKFRDYAQGLSMQLLVRHANIHLKTLRPRYRLVSHPESPMDIVLLDKDMADERRPMQSLSGGESFLVSLALALGLSGMAAQDLSIDSLFIDEGFGTLDSESLNFALAVLQNLHLSGKQVGLISHVEGIASSLGVELHLEMASSGSSRVKIRELSI